MSRFTNLSSFTTGRKTVSVAGTPEKLSSVSQPIPPGVSLAIKANHANTGLVHIGNSSANANSSTSTVSVRLIPDQATTMMIQDTDRVWVDVSVSGDGVEYFFEV